MTFRQQRLYRDRCDLYRVNHSVKEPIYKDVPCLLDRDGVHRYGFAFSELKLNVDRWYFPISQVIQENWVICLQTEGHPERGQWWLIRGTPKGRAGRVGHWEVISERHFVFPSSLM